MLQHLWTDTENEATALYHTWQANNTRGQKVYIEGERAR